MEIDVLVNLLFCLFLNIVSDGFYSDLMILCLDYCLLDFNYMEFNNSLIVVFLISCKDWDIGCGLLLLSL